MTLPAMSSPNHRRGERGIHMTLKSAIPDIDIAEAKTRVNQRVARYLRSHPHLSYSQIAETLGASRWRVLTVAAGMGISRKTGPKTSLTQANKQETRASERPSGAERSRAGSAMTKGEKHDQTHRTDS